MPPSKDSAKKSNSLLLLNNKLDSSLAGLPSSRPYLYLALAAENIVGGSYSVFRAVEGLLASFSRSFSISFGFGGGGTRLERERLLKASPGAPIAIAA